MQSVKVKTQLKNKKSKKFIKEQEAGELLSSLRIKTLLCKIPLVGTLLF